MSAAIAPEGRKVAPPEARGATTRSYLGFTRRAATAISLTRFRPPRPDRFATTTS